MTAAERATDGILAPAKVNLSLQLCGQRGDGYHLLDSLVVFPRIGDHLTAEPANGLSLSLDGPFAGSLSSGGDNLVLQAAALLSEQSGGRHGAALHLTKNLPVASGIGGGSSDAAAALRLLSNLWKVEIPDGLAARLGADIPVCLCAPEAQRMQGIGEDLITITQMPEFWIVMVNPGIGVPTGAVFSNTPDKNPPRCPEPPAQGFATFDDLIGWLQTQRNDLQRAAEALCPPITTILAALSGAPLARMSGSGATCFALFETEAQADTAADTLRTAHPDWWVAHAPVDCQRAPTAAI